MGKNLGTYKAKVIDLAMQYATKKYNMFGFSESQLNSKVRSQVEFTGIPDRDIQLVLKTIESIISSHAMHNN